MYGFLPTPDGTLYLLFFTQLRANSPNCQKCQLFHSPDGRSARPRAPFPAGCCCSGTARTGAPRGPRIQRRGWAVSWHLPSGAPDPDRLALSSPHRGREARPGGLHLLQRAGGQGGGHGQRRLEHDAGVLCGHPHREWPGGFVGGPESRGHFQVPSPLQGRSDDAGPGRAHGRLRAGEAWLRGSRVTDHSHGGARGLASPVRSHDACEVGCELRFSEPGRSCGPCLSAQSWGGAGCGLSSGL